MADLAYCDECEEVFDPENDEGSFADDETLLCPWCNSEPAE